MYKNGISHLTAASDLDGALQIVNYLMFIPGASFSLRKREADFNHREARSSHPYPPYRRFMGPKRRVEAKQGTL